MSNFTVTVEGTYYGNKFLINNNSSLSITLNKGETYIFSQNDSTNINHPLSFSLSSSN